MSFKLDKEGLFDQACADAVREMLGLSPLYGREIETSYRSFQAAWPGNMVREDKAAAARLGWFSQRDRASMQRGGHAKKFKMMPL